MNAWEPMAAGDAPAFEIVRGAPPGLPPPTPLVYASPHSGSFYPPDMMQASGLRGVAIRRSEDALVDRLIEGAPARGVSTLGARFARAYIDVNREAFELDPQMFADELPHFARARTARVAAGLGTIARVVADGQEIYARKLTFAEARQRIETIHRPYHAALEALIAEARAAHGFAVLLDWHSMPAAAARAGWTRERAPDIVLGDRFGGACGALLSERVQRGLESAGYRVARNTPYAGGYTTEHYGRPEGDVHALQIEINRSLYLDEATLEPTAGLATLKGHLDGLTEALVAADWGMLRR